MVCDAVGAAKIVLGGASLKVPVDAYELRIIRTGISIGIELSPR